MKRSALLFAVLSSVFLTGVVSAQVIVNGGFESGGFAPGWSFVDASGFTDVANDPTLSHSGDYFAELGASPDPGSLLQTLNTTPGQTYQLSFWLASDRSTSVSNSFQVLWNGTSVFSQTDIPAPGVINPYFNFTIDNLPAAAVGGTTLEFVYRNDDDFFRLDDVAINVVPETSTTYLVAIGFAMLGFAYFRRAKTRRALSA